MTVLQPTVPEGLNKLIERQEALENDAKTKRSQTEEISHSALAGAAEQPARLLGARRNSGRAGAWEAADEQLAPSSKIQRLGDTEAQGSK